MSLLRYDPSITKVVYEGADGPSLFIAPTIATTSASPYNAYPKDELILANGITDQVIVLPTIGIPIGKKYTIKIVAAETVCNDINVHAGDGAGQGPTANIDAWPTTGASNFQIWTGTSATTPGGSATLVWDGTQYWSI